ncbi:DUF308 domain-containing protein [Paracoccus sp. 11-3]|uniref:DUF308 domain-containing protein n=1 Tax=Paracoccus amoyensis TaxID=2760093 RepID=A0A926GAT2_9RHOB|nr:DUF308 domain-containing protein [Paracoccus amoyensis]MBC9246531.1 DUF308 domain-containing protein [Paracoccus amoyensis]
MSSRILWIIMGVIAIIAGIFALANPLAATLTAEQLAGWAFLIVGILDLIATFRSSDEGKIWGILLGIAYIILGIALLANPFQGIIALTVMVGVILLVSGVTKLIWSFGLRGTNSFWLVLLSGLLSLLLAIMIFGNFPAAALSILGILLAIELISSGVSMIALSSVVAADRRAY